MKKIIAMVLIAFSYTPAVSSSTPADPAVSSDLPCAENWGFFIAKNPDGETVVSRVCFSSDKVTQMMLNRIGRLSSEPDDEQVLEQAGRK
ncbi:MAG: hypothetical protein LBR89_02495 [Holosporales bacterium]|jgi:hypothetical protein|nr:hypothetical protein [Holosporales bacterium]